MPRCWLAVPHLKIYLDIHLGLGVEAAQPSVSTYRELAQALHRVDETLHTKLAALRAGWHGPAAEDAARALAPFATWAADTEAGITAEADAAQECADAYADARNHVPPPNFLPTKPVTTTAWLPALVGNRVDYEPVEVQVDAAHAEAARAMEVYEERVATALAALPPLLTPPRLDVTLLTGGLLPGVAVSASVGGHGSTAPAAHGHHAPPPPHPVPDPVPAPVPDDDRPVLRTSTVDRSQVWSTAAPDSPHEEQRQQNPPRPQAVKVVPEPRTERPASERKYGEAESEEAGLGVRDGVLGFHPATPLGPPAPVPEAVAPAVLGQ
ncbi:hypothetical protein JOF53_003317 [Crossiella equi]|uniref:PPE domain-containing protein n=1 Tax=Crossiella equi TaxID=130796 RepID=A0ABS5AFK0_9PSEU|nr:PPE domain-containing protein [Crossiella equi]MBP2474445.1 hypothetical protein [Crossiella equi]